MSVHPHAASEAWYANNLAPHHLASPGVYPDSELDRLGYQSVSGP